MQIPFTQEDRRILHADSLVIHCSSVSVISVNLVLNGD